MLCSGLEEVSDGGGECVGGGGGGGGEGAEPTSCSSS